MYCTHDLCCDLLPHCFWTLLRYRHKRHSPNTLTAGPFIVLDHGHGWDQGGQGKQYQGQRGGMSKSSSDAFLQLIQHSLDCRDSKRVMTYLYCLAGVSESPKDIHPEAWFWQNVWSRNSKSVGLHASSLHVTQQHNYSMQGRGLLIFIHAVAKETLGILAQNSIWRLH